MFVGTKLKSGLQHETNFVNKNSLRKWSVKLVLKSPQKGAFKSISWLPTPFPHTPNNGLKICENCSNLTLSYKRGHAPYKSATPNQIMMCKYSLMLYRLYNSVFICLYFDHHMGAAHCQHWLKSPISGFFVRFSKIVMQKLQKMGQTKHVLLHFQMLVDTKFMV